MTSTAGPARAGVAHRDGPQARYQHAVARLGDRLAAAPPGAPVRLRKSTSNLFRPRRPAEGPVLDVADLDGVLHVDPAGRTADVLGMTTYEHLVDATLEHGVMPLVVPQLKTITLGGAVTGLGIESSSFRHGLPHESVLEMDVLTGTGEVVTARPDNQHRDLFFGFPNSYGTLGYALRLRIELQPVSPYVALRHLRFDDRARCFAVLADIVRDRRFDGRDVDFLDGVAFDARRLHLTVGTFADEAPYTSDYTGTDVYYRSVERRREDYLTVRDYLWRWDTDWFWCSAAFGAQHRLVRRLWPKRWLRSDVYWRLVALEGRYGVKRRYDRVRGRPARESVVQDVEVPVEQSAEFLARLVDTVGLTPVWLCPLRQRDPSARWDLYPLDPQTTYVNFGFWGTVPLRPGQVDGDHNRLVERLVAEHHGRKSLYSTSYYDEDEFWRCYGGPTYGELKARYDPGGRFLDLYDKCVRRR